MAIKRVFSWLYFVIRFFWFLIVGLEQLEFGALIKFAGLDEKLGSSFPDLEFTRKVNCSGIGNFGGSDNKEL